MPVVITGATGLIGRALVDRLVAEGAQVRAYVRRDDAALRAAGAHLAVGSIDDVPRIESTCTGAHTLVHLVGGWWPARGITYDYLNRDTTESAVIAARAADVQRFILLSVLGADPASSNDLLASKGKAEDHVRASGMEYAIFRCAFVWESLPWLFERLVRGPAVQLPGNGAQVFTPVALADVIDAIVAADGRENVVEGTWDLGGASRYTMDELAKRSVPGKMIVHAGFASPAPKALAEVLAGGLVADPGALSTQFGLSPGDAARGEIG